MIGENRHVERSKRTRKAWVRYLAVSTLILAVKRREQAIMVRSKPKPKREKREETIEEFVRRVNQKAGKRNGLKRQVKGARR